jgi:hypothetical protein
MPERRRLLRSRVYYGGLLAFSADHSTLACVVRNFSTVGARIEFGDGAMLPDEVQFVVERRAISRPARVVWRNRHAAGLAFSDAHNASGVIPIEWARRLQAADRTNQQLRSQIERLSPKP